MKRIVPAAVTIGGFAVLVGLVAGYATRQFLPEKPAAGAVVAERPIPADEAPGQPQPTLAPPPSAPPSEAPAVRRNVLGTVVDLCVEVETK